ncbi:hypothetical protein IWX64_003125 [Arthrobacter sp. CAN_A212]|nr:hypothetical protein [Arthrobacter sp. CAN_C5]
MAGTETESRNAQGRVTELSQNHPRSIQRAPWGSELARQPIDAVVGHLHADGRNPRVPAAVIPDGLVTEW